MEISDVTRLALLDELALSPHHWCGRLEEPAFLARLYELDALPSTDHRYKDAFGDIYQHRINNHDWEHDWVFTDPRFNLSDDQALLRFLAETLHPMVRPDQGDVAELLEMYNRHLRPDGWELRQVDEISGRPVFAPQPLLSIPIAVEKVRVRAGDMGYLHEQSRRMEAAIEPDPSLAIGTAKELIETCCKTILDEAGVVPDRRWDLPKLLKETTKRLRLTPAHIADDARGATSSRQVLASLGSAVAGLAELRNEYGTGHGRPAAHAGLQPRHARLAVGAASAVAMFLFETYDQRGVVDADEE